MERLNRLKGKIPIGKAYVFTNPVSLTYLSGMDNVEGLILATSEEMYLLTDFRYLEAVEKRFPGKVLDHSGKAKEVILERLQYYRINQLYFEEELSFAKYREYKKYFEGQKIEFLPGENILRDLRLVKSQEELQRIRKSAEINNQIFEAIFKEIKAGVRELELKVKLEILLREFGGQDSSFDLIVLFGKHTSQPHGVSGTDPLRDGMPILLDIGVVFEGYSSDMTRMIWFGTPNKDFLKRYSEVLEIQEKALKMVKPGTRTKDIHEKVREALEEKGFELQHSTGHGVGLEIHEEPSLNATSETVLKEGMVITIEPGIYLKDQWGIRIEDLLIVTKDGYERLSRIDKKLWNIQG